MHKLFSILLFAFSLLSNSGLLAEIIVSDDKEKIKEKIDNIVNNEPFPVKVTDTRWILDMDDEQNESDKTDSFQLPVQLIQMIAVLSEYILWIVVFILFLLAYLNRHLLKIDRLSFKKANGRVDVTELSENDDNISLSAINSKLKQLLANKEHRQLVSFVYKKYIGASDYIENDATEIDIQKAVKKQGKEAHDFVKLLTEIRIKTAFSHEDVDIDDINQLLIYWESLHLYEKK